MTTFEALADALQEQIQQLRRREAHLASDVNLRDSELGVYYKHIASLQQRLDASNDQLGHAQAQIVGSNQLNKENLHLLEHYKHQCRTLRKNLLEAEERNVGQVKQILSLQDLLRESRSGQATEPNNAKPNINASYKGPAGNFPLATATTNVSIGTKAQKDEQSKYIEDLRAVVNAPRPEYTRPTISPERIAIIAQYPTKPTPLNPQSAPFSPSKRPNMSPEAKKAGNPLGQPIFIKPVERTVSITPAFARAPASPSSISVSAPVSTMSTKKDESFSQNLRTTAEHLASQPDSQSRLFSNAATRQWLDQQMQTPVKPVVPLKAVNEVPNKSAKLIDFSNENSPANAKNRNLFGAPYGMWEPLKSRDTNIATTNVQDSPLSLTQRKENVNLVSYPSTPSPGEGQRLQQPLPSPGFRSPTPHATTAGRGRESSASYLRYPSTAPSGITSTTAQEKRGDQPASNFTTTYISKMAAFSSKWSTPSKGRSSGTSQAASTVAESRPASRTETPHWGIDEPGTRKEVGTPAGKSQESAKADITEEDGEIREGEANSPTDAPAKIKDASKVKEPAIRLLSADESAYKQALAETREKIRHMAEQSRRARASQTEEDRRKVSEELEEGEVPQEFPETLFQDDDTIPRATTPKPFTKDRRGPIDDLRKNEVEWPANTSIDRPIKGTRVLGGALDKEVKAMVLKKNAWGLQRHVCYSKGMLPYQFHKENQMELCRDLCGNLWSRNLHQDPERPFWRIDRFHEIPPADVPKKDTVNLALICSDMLEKYSTPRKWGAEAERFYHSGRYWDMDVAEEE